MKKTDVPFWVGDILEFKICNTLVRGEISYVTFSKDEATATIYDMDTFTKMCSKCSSKCEFFKDGLCRLSASFPVDCDEIKPEEIGKKYKRVKKSWKIKQEDNSNVAQ